MAKRYIVTFTDPAGPPAATAEILTRGSTAPGSGMLQRLGAAIVELEDDDRAALEADAGIAEVIEDFVVRAIPAVRGARAEAQPFAWPITLIKADQTWKTATGRGVKVAVLDTGIDANHPDLTIAGGVSFVPDSESWHDDQGHGTHCAGIVAARNDDKGTVGVAPDAELYAIKVLSGDGSGQFSWILAGLGWALENGMDVVSMSLGSDVEEAGTECPLAYQRAAEQLADAGCIVIAAAGNSGEGPGNPWVGIPARCDGYMAVAAVDAEKQLAPFSSRGPDELGPGQAVEIAAPGVDINSTVPGGGYEVFSGTSMACPHVAGAAALVKQTFPDWSAQQIRERLRGGASDLPPAGRDVGTGFGLLDCLAAVAKGEPGA
ncbi:S8 family peptidase [Marinivivus vitaminiproducens]|uniref:S8 family peptidase n=1 Tax=Marinivivus vitaminiproducens TaxID=3035935 RepID=UPI0027A6C249|nr:S8 family peptidase [Geminicoccaceae bacterium SCSIO 64248]